MSAAGGPSVHSRDEFSPVARSCGRRAQPAVPAAHSRTSRRPSGRGRERTVQELRKPDRRQLDDEPNAVPGAAALRQVVAAGALEDFTSDQTQLDRELAQMSSQQQVEADLERLKAV